MSDLDLAYAAGVIDSDGHITLVRKVRARRDESPVVYYQPTVGCGQIIRTVPDFLAETFGGKVYESAATFQWQCYSAVAYRAAEALLPFLRLKRSQAEILLRYEESLSTEYGPRVAGRAGRITAEQAAVRAELYAEVRLLNIGSRRGYVSPEMERLEIPVASTTRAVQAEGEER